MHDKLSRGVKSFDLSNSWLVIGRKKHPDKEFSDSWPYEYIAGIRELKSADTFFHSEDYLQPGEYCAYVEFYWENESLHHTGVFWTMGKYQCDIQKVADDPESQFLEQVMIDCAFKKS